MKTAIVFSVPMTTSRDFGWRWRAEDFAHESAEWFVFYRDCVADANRHGYSVRESQDRRYETLIEGRNTRQSQVGR